LPKKSFGLVIGACLAGACSEGGNASPPEMFSSSALQLPAGENALHIADFNGDGFNDLISASEFTGEVAIRAGDGQGGLSLPTLIRAGDLPTSIDSADLDGDGVLDLIVANHEQAYVTVIIGDGRGGAKSLQRVSLPHELSPHPHMVRAADLNGDGVLDLVVDSRDHSGVFVLLQVDGESLRFESVALDVQGSPYLGFALGDVNADGWLDLATPNAGDVSVIINTGTPDANLVVSQQIPVPSPFAADIADINCDGYPDLIVVSEDSDAGLMVFTGDGTGIFPGTASFQASLDEGAKQLGVSDVDGDGCSDVIVSAWSGGARVFFGARSGTALVEHILQITANPWTVVSGDLDGDGIDEIVISDGISGEARVLRWKN
jgi:hypothetical protein